MNKRSGLGGCIISNNILENKGSIKWCFREEPVNELDNGWRFLSDVDTDEFLSDSRNLSICDYQKVIDLEPAVFAIYELPIGTDLTIIKEGGNTFFVTETGELILPVN